MPRQRTGNIADFAAAIALVIGILLIGILLFFLIRVQRGLLGLILGGLAAGLMIYWIREIRSVVRRELGQQAKKAWTYDILEGEDVVTIVTEVPGPSETVRVEFKDGSLKIFGGQGFKKKIGVPKGLRVAATSYINGILNVRMSRREDPSESGARRGSLNRSDEES